ncbi:MAG TPA: hypothetical protein VIV60_22170, partial [Polyangiaceae bacterium]
IEAYREGKSLTQPIKFQPGQWEQSIALTLEDPWKTEANGAHRKNGSKAAPRGLPFIRVQVGSEQCDVKNEYLEASFVTVNARLRKCATPSSVTGQERYEMQIQKDGQIGYLAPRTPGLDTVTHACIDRTLRSVTNTPELGGCTVQLTVQVGP